MGRARRFFSLDSEANLVRAVHAERGPIRIEGGSYYAYVRSVIFRLDGKFRKEDWLEYVQVYSGAGNQSVQQRMFRFDALISAYNRGAEFETAVRWHSSSGTFLVVEGFHCLACMAAIDPEKRVKRRVLF